MSRKGQAAAAGEQPGGTFRELADRGRGKGGGSLWAKTAKKGKAEEPRRARTVSLVDAAEMPARCLDKARVKELLDLIDFVYPSLDPKERNIMTIIWRHSRGAGEDTCVLSLPELARLSNMSQTGVQYVVGRLELLKLVEKVEKIIGKGKGQGARFRIIMPASLG